CSRCDGTPLRTTIEPQDGIVAGRGATSLLDNDVRLEHLLAPRQPRSRTRHDGRLPAAGGCCVCRRRADGGPQVVAALRRRRDQPLDSPTPAA
ncbi:MAG TPA: hypothetical protein VMD59_13885, partial [Acidimicrobiales bacterium]|nr:hypothetical protein [Acidimicrobiales bacterium]